MPLSDREKRIFRDYVANLNPGNITQVMNQHPLNTPTNGGPCAMYAYAAIRNYVNYWVNKDLFIQLRALPSGSTLIGDYTTLLGIPFGSVLLVWNQTQPYPAVHFVVYLDQGLVVGYNHGGYLFSNQTNYQCTIDPYSFGSHHEFIYDESVLTVYQLLLAMQSFLGDCINFRNNLVSATTIGRVYASFNIKRNAFRPSPQRQLQLLYTNINIWIQNCDACWHSINTTNAVDRNTVLATLNPINRELNNPNFGSYQLYRIYSPR